MERVLPRVLDLRRRSLLRGNLLVAGSLAVAMLLADFPANRANPFLALPLAVSVAGTVETARCMQPAWSWYHGGVILCVYMDLMVMSMILFSLLYPYASWLSGTH